jgi:CheY-like chemotaxis protein
MQHGGARVLVIDDDPRILSAIAVMLEARGLVVATAETIGAACEEAARFDPEVVVTDYRLPDGTGLAAIERLRAERGTALPALIITGDIGVAELREVAASGMPMLSKPVSRDELLRELGRAIESAKRAEDR